MAKVGQRRLSRGGSVAVRADVVAALGARCDVYVVVDQQKLIAARHSGASGAARRGHVAGAAGRSEESAQYEVEVSKVCKPQCRPLDIAAELAWLERNRLTCM